MRIAILHYHLDSGGVGRVIDLAAMALAEAGHEVAVIAGSFPHKRSLLDRMKVGVVPSMNYSFLPCRLDDLAASVEREARRILGDAPDIWHFHNPTLGKNPMVSLLAAAWARQGKALVLQIHDFAEQDRPQNYRLLRDVGAKEGGLREFLYPVQPGVRYAVLNAHDAAILNRAGLPHRATVLPNPVQPLPLDAPFDPALMEAEDYMVYPTRAIPRKNLGEALLWSARFAAGRKMVMTLAPENPSRRAAHDAWEKFSRERGLPVVFDAVNRFGRALGDFVSGARASFTTSISEGFGMAYLEPWLLGTPVIGRDLPNVTDDFTAYGLQQDWLYSSLPVELRPGEEVAHEFYLRNLRTVREHAYGLSRAAPLWERGKMVDFGLLHPSLQMQVLSRILDEGISDLVVPDLQLERSAARIEEMQDGIRNQFGLDTYAARLESLYQSALSSSKECGGGTDFLDPAAVLEGFLGE